jgi:hypothetical protein
MKTSQTPYDDAYFVSSVLLDGAVVRHRKSYGEALDSILAGLLGEGLTVAEIVLEQHPGRTIVVARGVRIAELTFGGYSKHDATLFNASA